MKVYKFVCPDHGIVDTCQLWSNRIEPRKCTKCDRILSPEIDEPLTQLDNSISDWMNVNKDLSNPERWQISHLLIKLHQFGLPGLELEKNAKYDRFVRKSFEHGESGITDDWVDHSGMSKKGNFVSEPYHISTGKLKKILDFCAKNNLGVSISGCSYHYPNSTLRIEFKKNEK